MPREYRHSDHVGKGHVKTYSTKEGLIKAIAQGYEGAGDSPSAAKQKAENVTNAVKCKDCGVWFEGPRRGD